MELTGDQRRAPENDDAADDGSEPEHLPDEGERAGSHVFAVQRDPKVIPSSGSVTVIAGNDADSGATPNALCESRRPHTAMIRMT